MNDTGRDCIVNNGSRRITHQIGRKPAANIHHATRLADRIGYPLNQFVTINYSKTPCAADEASAVFRVLLASWFSRWLRRHPKPWFPTDLPMVGLLAANELILL